MNIQPTNNQIVYFTRFHPLRQALDGGDRRTLQIIELLKNIAPLQIDTLSTYHQQSTAPKLNKPFIQKLYIGVSSVLEKLNFYDFKREFTSTAIFFRWAAAKWLKKIQNLPQLPKVIVIDDALFFPNIVAFANKNKIPIVSILQNIESMGGGIINEAKKVKIFEKEMAILKKCDCIVSISYEENLLLKHFDIQSVCLPYFPPEKIRQKMQLIKNERVRSGNLKKHILLLGSATNPPTLQGMQMLIKYFNESNLLNLNCKLLVAGFGTEVLKKEVKNEYIEVLGKVEQGLLNELLTTVKCNLIYQKDAAGALTRVAELLIAGVPVVANVVAARSYYNVEGVWVYENFAQIEKIIELLPPFLSKNINFEYMYRFAIEQINDQMQGFLKTV